VTVPASPGATRKTPNLICINKVDASPAHNRSSRRLLRAGSFCKAGQRPLVEAGRLVSERFEPNYVPIEDLRVPGLRPASITESYQGLGIPSRPVAVPA
jgi:hypothetical protein